MLSVISSINISWQRRGESLGYRKLGTNCTNETREWEQKLKNYLTKIWLTLGFFSECITTEQLGLCHVKEWEENRRKDIMNSSQLHWISLTGRIGGVPPAWITLREEVVVCLWLLFKGLHHHFKMIMMMTNETRIVARVTISVWVCFI